MAKQKPAGPRLVCLNRRARHDYDILSRFEAGLALTGSEVKALREGKGNLTDAWAEIRGSIPLLNGLEISPYSHDRSAQLAPRRQRKLLLHAAEIRKLKAELHESGLALVPLSIYFKGPWAKIELGLARGRKKADKRQALRRREAERDMDRAYKRR